MNKIDIFNIIIFNLSMKMTTSSHYSRILLDLYRSGRPDLRSAMKLLIQFYPLEINKSLDAGGNTLLHYAFSYKDHDMIYFLLENGATLSIKNYGHMLPTHIV